MQDLPRLTAGELHRLNVGAAGGHAGRRQAGHLAQLRPHSKSASLTIGPKGRTMSEPPRQPGRRKSVGLSGVAAGNTALCTVGRSGNDLHYRGYDILDFADSCEFEEIAYLLVHGTLPTRAELAAYKAKLSALRGLPAAVKAALEALPAASHPMDVMRTGVSALGCVLPEKDDHNQPGARDIADRLMASLGSMLLYWYHYRPQRQAHRRRDRRRHDRRALPASAARRSRRELFVRAMHTSLILYAEHEFNASTFTCRVIAGTGADMYSAITGGIGALRGPKHGGANEVAFEIQNRYAIADEAEADIRKRVEAKEVVIGFGHPVYTIADPRNKVIKEVAQAPVAGGRLHADVRHRRPHRGRDEGRQEDVREPRLVQRRRYHMMGVPTAMFTPLVRHLPHLGLGAHMSSNSASTTRSSVRPPTTPAPRI